MTLCRASERPLGPEGLGFGSKSFIASAKWLWLSTVRAVIFRFRAVGPGNNIGGVKSKYAWGVIIVAVMMGATRLRAGDLFVAGDAAAATISNNKGLDLVKRGEYAKARQYYDAAIAQSPKDWVAYLNRAELSLHEQNGRWRSKT